MAMSRASARKSSVFATKSVSQLISTMAPIRPPPWMYASTTPSEAARPARLAAAAWPRSRRSSTARSKSPSASWSARLESIIPAPVSSRSRLTSPAETVMSPPILTHRPWLPAHLGRLRLMGSLLGRSLCFSGGCLGSDLRFPGSGVLGLERCWRLRLHRLGDAGAFGQVPAGESLPLSDRFGDHRGHEGDRADRVVVPGDHVVHLVGVAVRVDDGHDGYAELVRLGHRDLLLLRVDHVDRRREPLQILDPPEVSLELLFLPPELQDLLLREEVEGAGALHLAQLHQTPEPTEDRLE